MIIRQFRFICAQNLQTEGHNCHDFEARFCCPINKDVSLFQKLAEDMTIDEHFENKTSGHHFEIPNNINDLRIVFEQFKVKISIQKMVG